MREYLLILAVGVGFISSVIVLGAPEGTASLQAVTDQITSEMQTAAIFFVPSITVAELNDSYHGVLLSPTLPEKKVRVLIVPGHQPDKGGAEYKGVYERDVVVDIADSLVALLKQNVHYEVMVARTKEAWHPTLRAYFDTHAIEIDTFRQSQAAQMEQHIENGNFLPQVDQVYHNTAPIEAVLQLYGINKWASENHYDIILHLHLNDYAGRKAVTADSYTGFAIYVPNHQYSNAEASIAIGHAIAGRLNAYHATSTLPKEDKGVVEDQELIAIGSNNSADDAALLIEYAYIYEPQFHTPSLRSLAVADYALQTYLGLQDFFDDPLVNTYGSVSFPYNWNTVSVKMGVKGPGIYALQSALRHLGYYPPSGSTFSDCPISGRVGACTVTGLKAYQRARGLPATGTLGPKTREVLKHDLTLPETPSSVL